MNLLDTTLFTSLKIQAQTILTEELPTLLTNGQTFPGIKTMFAHANGTTLTEALSILPDAGVPIPTEDKSSRQKFWSGIKQAFAAVDDEYQRLVKQHLDPFFGTSRLQQMEEMAGDGTRIAVTSDEKNLNRYIGASLIIRNRVPVGTYWSEHYMQAPFFVSYWPSASEPDIQLSLAFMTGSNFNESGWSDPRVDALINESRGEGDLAVRKEQFAEIQQIISHEGGGSSSPT